MRLVTRGDLDGLTCAVLITECEPVDDILLVHPQDITDKKVAIGKQDILANIPYHPDCGKWFDHHLLTESNARPPASFEGGYSLAPSAARVVYDYYIGSHPDLRRYDTLLAETDRVDAAQLTVDDVLDPKGYVLLAFTLDPRTGLGAFLTYFITLVDWLKKKSIEEILKQPQVAERVRKIREQDHVFLYTRSSRRPPSRYASTGDPTRSVSRRPSATPSSIARAVPTSASSCRATAAAATAARARAC
jgi:hypothetical protein